MKRTQSFSLDAFKRGEQTDAYIQSAQQLCSFRPDSRKNRFDFQSAAVMGACATLPASRQMSGVPKMRWRARERWFNEKEGAAENVSQLLLEPPRMQNLLPRLYASLGGNAEATSPIILKGGAAFAMYMTREITFHGDTLPSSVHNFAYVADLDFACHSPAALLIERAAAALPWLANVSTDIWPSFERACPQWRLRRDAGRGEAFFDGRRIPLDYDKTMYLPVKLSFHGGLTEKHTGTEFQLLRIGAALWHKKMRRAAVAAFVDVSLGNAVVPTVCVMGMRVQAPRSLLKVLRRMTFHEAEYAPWTAAFGDEAKQERRVERLVKLSFVEDWKTMGGTFRSPGALESLQSRWRKALGLLFLSDTAELRRFSLSAPPQMRFILVCCARTAEMAAATNMLEDYNWWIDYAVTPLILDVCGDLVYQE